LPSVLRGSSSLLRFSVPDRGPFGRHPPHQPPPGHGRIAPKGERYAPDAGACVVGRPAHGRAIRELAETLTTHHPGGPMAATNINRVVLTGNLTRDPELRSTHSGISVCSLRVATNTRRKNQSTGEWEDKPNFFDVTVWGAQGENCARFLAKGRPVAFDGRLEWREWEDQQGNTRQAIDIIADAVQFLASANGSTPGEAPQHTAPTGDSDFEPSPDTDDIPF
jgi:single-strand DNA-binding protein